MADVMMNRRSFLGSILAAAVAPAIVHASSLMAWRPTFVFPAGGVPPNLFGLYPDFVPMSDNYGLLIPRSVKETLDTAYDEWMSKFELGDWVDTKRILINEELLPAGPFVLSQNRAL